MISRLSSGEKVGQKFFKEVKRGIELLDDADGKVVVDDVVLGQLGGLCNLVPVVLWSEGA